MNSFIQTFRDLRYRTFYGLLMDRNAKVARFGSSENECHWLLDPATLCNDSVVYSGGVGRDISLEHDLVQRFGCQVYLFDPSPTGMETMKRPEHRIPQFTFEPTALYDRSGFIDIGAPHNAAEGSWSSVPTCSSKLSVPSTDLRSAMRRHGHKIIDLVKLDIEGTELPVLTDIIRQRIPIRQVLVEFHHGLIPGVTRGSTIRMILRLVMAGYRLLAQEGNNHTFILRSERPPTPSAVTF